MEQAWQCLLIMVYYSPCPLLQHPPFSVHIPGNVAQEILHTNRKGNRNRDFRTTVSEILHRSLDYQELDKISDMQKPVPDILEKSIPFLNTESQNS